MVGDSPSLFCSTSYQLFIFFFFLNSQHSILQNENNNNNNTRNLENSLDVHLIRIINYSYAIVYSSVEWCYGSFTTYLLVVWTGSFV